MSGLPDQFPSEMLFFSIRVREFLRLEVFLERVFFATLVYGAITNSAVDAFLARYGEQLLISSILSAAFHKACDTGHEVKDVKINARARVFVRNAIDDNLVRTVLRVVDAHYRTQDTLS